MKMINYDLHKIYTLLLRGNTMFAGLHVNRYENY